MVSEKQRTLLLSNLRRNFSSSGPHVIMKEEEEEDAISMEYRPTPSLVTYQHIQFAANLYLYIYIYILVSSHKPAAIITVLTDTLA